MKLTYSQTFGELSDIQLQDCYGLSVLVFGQASEPNMRWRLERMPDVSAFWAHANEKLVGFKLGYAVSRDRYYSWLGGVRPEARGAGIARQLMQAQHQWLVGTSYREVETITEQRNTRMCALNLAAGFAAVGFETRRDVPRLIFRKSL